LIIGIDLAGDKVINDQIIYEEPSYEEKELKKYRLIVGLRTRPSLINLLSWTVSRWDV
jgi:hypothetical protein